jgi:hypothetical protein
MNLKSVQNYLRGWLPKEQALPICQTSQENKMPVFVHRMAIAVVVGSIGGALLGVAGNLFGLDKGIGMFAWPITTGLIIGGGVGLFAVYMQRKLGLHTRNQLG